jgi:hypothetical protein
MTSLKNVDDIGTGDFVTSRVVNPWKSGVRVISDIPIKNRMRLLDYDAVVNVIAAFMPHTPEFMREYRRFEGLMRRKKVVPSAKVERMVKRLIFFHWSNLKKQKECSWERNLWKEYYGLRSIDIIENVCPKTFYKYQVELCEEGILQRKEISELFYYLRNEREGKRKPKKIKHAKIRYVLNLHLILASLLEARQCTIEGDLGFLTRLVSIHGSDELMWDRLGYMELLRLFGRKKIRGMRTNDELIDLFPPDEVAKIMKKNQTDEPVEPSHLSDPESLFAPDAFE